MRKLAPEGGHKTVKHCFALAEDHPRARRWHLLAAIAVCAGTATFPAAAQTVGTLGEAINNQLSNNCTVLGGGTRGAITGVGKLNDVCTIAGGGSAPAGTGVVGGGNSAVTPVTADILERLRRLREEE